MLSDKTAGTQRHEAGQSVAKRASRLTLEFCHELSPPAHKWSRRALKPKKRSVEGAEFQDDASDILLGKSAPLCRGEAEEELEAVESPELGL